MFAFFPVKAQNTCCLSTDTGLLLAPKDGLPNSAAEDSACTQAMVTAAVTAFTPTWPREGAGGLLPQKPSLVQERHHSVPSPTSRCPSGPPEWPSVLQSLTSSAGKGRQMLQNRINSQL